MSSDLDKMLRELRDSFEKDFEGTLAKHMPRKTALIKTEQTWLSDEDLTVELVKIMVAHKKDSKRAKGSRWNTRSILNHIPADLEIEVQNRIRPTETNTIIINLAYDCHLILKGKVSDKKVINTIELNDCIVEFLELKKSLSFELLTVEEHEFYDLNMEYYDLILSNLESAGFIVQEVLGDDDY